MIMRAPKTRIPNMPGDPQDKRISDRRHDFNRWRLSERRKWQDHPDAKSKMLSSISIPYAGGRDPDANVAGAIAEADRRYHLTQRPLAGKDAHTPAPPAGNDARTPDGPAGNDARTPDGPAGNDARTPDGPAGNDARTPNGPAAAPPSDGASLDA
jgi:hypothetical protein